MDFLGPLKGGLSQKKDIFLSHTNMHTHLDEGAGVDGVVVSSDGLRLLQIPRGPEICPVGENKLRYETW